MLDDLPEGQFAVNRHSAPRATRANPLLRVRVDLEVYELGFETEGGESRQEVAAAEAVVEWRVERPRTEAHALEGEVVAEGRLRYSEVGVARARAADVCRDDPPAAAFVLPGGLDASGRGAFPGRFAKVFVTAKLLRARPHLNGCPKVSGGTRMGSRSPSGVR